MNAWIDSMTSVDCPEDGMTSVHVCKGGFMILVLKNVNDMIGSCPLAYEALVDDVAFVNYSRMKVGEPPVLALSYHANPNR